MDHSFVRAKPAELLLVRHRLLQGSEIRHDFLNVFTLKTRGVKSRGLAHELIALAQREGKADTGPAVLIVELSHRVGVDRVLVDRIAAVALADGKARVARGHSSRVDTLWIIINACGDNPVRRLR